MRSLPTYSPGSLLRTLNKFEHYLRFGKFDAVGILFLMDKESIGSYYKGVWIERVLPFNERGLLYLDWHKPYDQYASTNYWCQVLYKEKLIWIQSDWLTLDKRSTEE